MTECVRCHPEVEQDTWAVCSRHVLEIVNGSGRGLGLQDPTLRQEARSGGVALPTATVPRGCDALTDREGPKSATDKHPKNFAPATSYSPVAHPQGPVE